MQLKLDIEIYVYDGVKIQRLGALTLFVQQKSFESRLHLLMNIGRTFNLWDCIEYKIKKANFVSFSIQMNTEITGFLSEKVRQIDNPQVYYIPTFFDLVVSN